MYRITGVIVALTTTVAVMSTAGSGSTSDVAPAARQAVEVPRAIPDGVELTLSDGDTFRIWTSPTKRAVWGRRLDAATGTWGDPQVVLKKDGLYCGDVDARTSNGAVAVTASCDEGSYYEDQAPTSSQALWSADTVSWSSYELEGEAYEEPGISPDGTNAVWPQSGGYLTRTEAGFAGHLLDRPGEQYSATATITDAEQVSYLYGAPLDRRCHIIVMSRSGDAAPTRQDLPFKDGCGDSSFVNIDSNTTWFGYPSDLAHRSTISRVDANSPWAVTEKPPARAPGLVEVSGRLRTQFFHSADGLLVALGSNGRRLIRAQLYDGVSRSWGSSTVIHDAGGARCAWGAYMDSPPLRVLAIALRCGSRRVVLTTPDARTWRALRAKNTYGASADGRYVAVPTRSVTHIISAERGIVTLPGGVTGKCDVVVPDGPDAAVLLTAAGRHRGWPTILQHSDLSGWRTLSKVRLPTFPAACRTVQPVVLDLPYRYSIRSIRTERTGYTVRKGYVVQIVEGDGGGWTVKHGLY